jgi:hypothetical protein
LLYFSFPLSFFYAIHRNPTCQPLSSLSSVMYLLSLLPTATLCQSPTSPCPFTCWLSSEQRATSCPSLNFRRLINISICPLSPAVTAIPSVALSFQGLLVFTVICFPNFHFLASFFRLYPVQFYTVFLSFQSSAKRFNRS